MYVEVEREDFKRQARHLRLDVHFVNHRAMNEGIQVQIKQVWRRTDDGLLVRVSGLILLEPVRVMWQALPNHDNPTASGILTETEFKERFEWRLQHL